MVIQVVRVSIQPAQRARWLEVISRDAAQTRTQPGCEAYQVSEDIEAPNSFVIVEQWGSQEAHFEHFRQPQFQELMGSLAQLLAGPPEVWIHDVASTRTLDEALAGAGLGAEA